MYQLNPLLESIHNNNSYEEALKIFNTLPENEKWQLCPMHGKYKNVPVLYRHVIPNKGFVDLYPHNHSDHIGFLLICVSPKYRGKGITYDLMKECIKDSKTLNIHRIWWVCNKDNVSSYKSALKNGFKLQRINKTEIFLYKEI